MERYNEITIGSVSSSLATTISGMDNEVAQNIKAAKSEMQKAINNATAQITGAKGGVIQTHFNADGEPYEMTIANNKNLASATKVWRWNIGGLGFSNTGYDGQYRTAITQDGSIVADFITTGTLDASKATITNINASNINTGTLSANLLKAGIIKNKNNNNTYWNLETGYFKVTDAHIFDATITQADMTDVNISNLGVDTNMYVTCSARFEYESTNEYTQIDNSAISGGHGTYGELGRLSFNASVTSGGSKYYGLKIAGINELMLSGHIWVDPDGNGMHRTLDDANIEIVNWIKWVTQRSSGVEWVKEGTEMGCGRATFHCGMLCQWTQFENVIVGD
jgi:hypothetical protein